MAVEHCQRGQFEQAQALFSAILEQLDPPETIRTLILQLEESGCPNESAYAKSWDLKMSTGYDSNVSQGIRASTLVLGPVDAPIELVLGDSYKPQPSSYAELTVGRNWESNDGWIFQAKLGGRQHFNKNASPYDLVSANATVKSSFPFASRTIEWTADATDLWLGGKHYQTALALAAQAPVIAGETAWNYSATTQYVGYHTQPQQNSAQYQLGISRQIRSLEGTAVLGVARIWDSALGQRAGGDRAGFALHAAGQMRVMSWLLTGRTVLTRWSTHDPFLPGLVNDRRRNILRQLSIQATYPLEMNQAMQVDLQARKSGDTVGLYAYRGYTASISWVARF